MIALGSHASSTSVEIVRDLEQKYLHYTDERLKAAARDFVEGRLDVSASDGHRSSGRYSTPLIDFDPVLLHGLALASAAFRRAPADLDVERPMLRDSQLAAAFLMLGGRHVQMDTGEGKTYALIAAAFAALGNTRRAYILTPNEILAERDAQRTMSFFDYLGVRVGLCTSGYGSMRTGHAAWGADVVYTTRSAIMTKHIEDLINRGAPKDPLIRSYIFLDESDAIVFDGRSDRHSVSVDLALDPAAWAEAFRVAGTVGPDEVDDDFARSEHLELNQLGWQRVINHPTSELRMTPWRFGRMVEAAYIATHCVVEGDDFEVQDGRLAAIDRHAGLVTGSRPDWLIALSHTSGFRPLASSEPIYTDSFFRLLRSFSTVGGASGTMKWVALDLVLALRMRGIPAEVGADQARADGEELDLVFRTREAALDAAVADAVLEAQRRPVLVGAQNGRDARDFMKLLQAAVADLPLQVELILPDRMPIDGFGHAGVPRRITVTTYFAARGTDIRLSPEAIEADGLHLVLLGHSLEGRLDRQFLGRAGRQGQPWSATFFSSVESAIFRAMGNQKIMSRTMSDHEPFQGRLVTKTLRNAQRQAVWLRQANAARNVMLSEQTDELHQVHESVLRAIQRFELSSEPQSSRRFAEELVARADPDSQGQSLAAFLADGLAGADGLDHICSMVAASAEPHETAVAVLTERMQAAVDRRRADIAEHEAYHRELSSLFALLQHAREMVGVPDPLAARPRIVIKNTSSAVEALVTELRAAIEAVESAEVLATADAALEGAAEPGSATIPAGSDDAVRDGVDGTLEPSDRAVPAPRDQAAREHLERLASAAWESGADCRGRHPCPRLRRTPYAALKWEAQRTWSESERSLSAAFREIDVSESSAGTRLMRRIAAVEQRRTQLDLKLAQRSTWVLLNLDRWAELDEVFFVTEHRRASMAIAPPRRGLWETPQADQAARELADPTPDPAIETALRRLVRDRPGDDATWTEDLVKRFLASHPVSSLQSGNACAAALQSFDSDSETMGVRLKRRRRNRAVLRQFLRLLHGEGLVPETPTIRHRITSRTRRARWSVGLVRHLDAALAVPSLVLLTMISAFVEVPIGPPDNGSSVSVLVAWGALSGLGWCLAGAVVRLRDAQRWAALNISVVLGGIGVAVVLVRVVLDVGVPPLTVVIRLAVAYFLATSMWRLARIALMRVGLDVLGLAGLVTLLWLVGTDGTAALLAGGLVIAIAEVVRQLFDRIRVPVVMGSVSSLHEHAVALETRLVLSLGLSLGRHLVAAVAVGGYLLWPGGATLGDVDDARRVLLLYCGLFAVFTFVDVRRRIELHSLEQVFAVRKVVPVWEAEELATQLARARRFVLAREWTCLAVGAAAAFAVLGERGSSSMVGIVTLIGGVAAGSMAVSVLASVREAFAGFASTSVVLDAHDPRAEAPTGLRERLVDLIRRPGAGLGRVIAFYALVIAALDFVGLIEFLLDGWDRLRDLLP